MSAARFGAGVLALALGYFLTAQVGLLLTHANSDVTLIWPPAGLAVAVLFRAGLRYWPGVLLGALACQLPQLDWWVALGVAAGSTAGPALTVTALRRFGFNPAAAGRKDLYAFLFAGLAGMTIGATNEVLWRAAAGLPASELLSTWLVRWLGSTSGLLIVGPPLLTVERPRFRRSSVRPALVLLLTTVLVALAFTNTAPPGFRSLMVFPPFMLLLWVGMTERLRIGSLHVLVIAAFAIGGTSAGQGAFAHMPQVFTKVLMVWALTTTGALIILALTTTLAERERAESALAAAARDYQSLVDQTPAAILRYTPEGTLTFVNETLCKLLGHSREHLIGQSVLDFIPKMPRREEVADLPVAAPFVAPTNGVSGLIRRPDGSRLWYRWTARLIKTAAGGDEFQAVGIDLTERRQAEEERIAIQRKMEDAQRLEALGVLAGGVAHDFNNLLAGVLGHAELAATLLPDGHPARPHLATVLSGVAQASGLTRQLLAYSGKGRFMLKTIDLNDVIKQTTDLLRVTLPKKVTLNLDLAPALPRITGDDGQLRQVLMNLLINAGEAIGDKAGTVTVTTAVHDLALDAVSGGVYSPSAPGQFLELIVSDTGCGMDDTTKARLFDPFFTTKFTGRGLGMSAVLGIVRGHGGGIRVDSRVGIGSRFTVLLPVPAEGLSGVLHASAASSALTPAPIDNSPRRARAAAAHDVATPAPTVTPPPARPVEPRGLALVADDEPIVRHVAELLLKQMGYTVLTASNGEEAVSLFTEHADEIRVVLLDLMMPVMDGAEALAAIRNRSAVPVILCSGYTPEAVPEELTADATTGFLQKPYARGDLQVALTAIGA